jgi:two-component system sensor histidine kinase PilS (NtrC family)
LLDNALRHAEPGPASVQVELLPDPVGNDLWVRLTVFNAGPPIPPEVERHLFEPFFSTRSRGSGLGLYICRELCERYGVRINYRYRSDPARPGNEFILHLPCWPTRVGAAPLLPPSLDE